jgi:predicted amidophosphoribosyltransferase
MCSHVETEHSRLVRGRKTFDVMLTMCCRDRHQSAKGLCASCAELQAYARERLAHCPFQAQKSTCLKCPVHCYKPEMRARVTDVMRYAGPLMTWRHPFLAIRHLIPLP